MRLVGQDDHIRAVAQQFGRLKFMHQREHIAVVAAQKFSQMCATGCVALITLGFAHCTHGFECLGDLIVQLGAVGHHHKSPVAHHLAQHLLRVKHHGKTLATALRLPEHTAAPMSQLAGFQHGCNGVVDPQELVVLRHDLDQARLVF